jgi:hypothetical protein
MIRILFQKWLKELNNKMKKPNCWIFLHFNNGPFHILGDLELSKIETTFLLPNTTSKIQFMDIRIIGFSNIVTIIINSKTPLTRMNEE